MPFIAQLNVRETARGGPLFDARSGDLHSFNYRLDQTGAIVIAVTLEKEAETCDLINFGIAAVRHLAFRWTQRYPLPGEKSDLLLDRSGTRAFPIDHAEEVTAFEYSVVRGEVVVANDLSWQKGARSILPTRRVRRNEVRDRQVVGSNGLPNFDQ